MNKKNTANKMLINQVATVVVTYNRLKLLQKLVPALLTQTRQIDKIIIVNNSSSDGTEEWLNNLSAQHEQVVVIKQDNVGGAGGQYTGGKVAFELGYEGIGHMDDDIIPQNDCLENLLKYAKEDLCCAALRYAADGTGRDGTGRDGTGRDGTGRDGTGRDGGSNRGKLFMQESAKHNLTNPFKTIFEVKAATMEEIYDENCSIIPVEDVSFEGILLHRNMVEKAGFIDKKFFICYDDVEYSVRLRHNGIALCIIKDAVCNRLLSGAGWSRVFDGKTYYVIRNGIAVDVLHGNFGVRLLRPFGHLLVGLSKCKNIDNVKITFNAFRDGYFYKQEN